MKKRVRIGQITIESFPRKSLSVEPESDHAPYLGALGELRSLLVAGTWALAGGLVVPIAVGRFYRKHNDIDIVMPMERLCDVVQAFRSAGYELYTSWHVNHRSRGLLMESRIKSDGRLVQLRPRHLYVKREARDGDGWLLEKIDLYPYRHRGKYLETCNASRMLSKCVMQRRSLEPFERTGHVYCLHLDNVASLKATRTGAKHRLDCAVIRHGPKAAGDWFQRIGIAPPAAPSRLRPAGGQ
jgi:hypothetical protein